MPPIGIPLKALRPKWLADVDREHMGLEMDCPRHPDGHRVQLWFANPGDGGAPRFGASYWVTSLCELEELTLSATDGAGHRAIKIGHWTGWLADGQLFEATFPSER